MPRIFMVQTQKHAQLTLLLLDWSQAAGSPHPCATRSSHSVFTAVTGDELIARPPEAASRDQSEVHPDSVASGHWRSIARRVRDRAATGSAGPSCVLSPKYEVFCRRSVGCFSRRERSAHIRIIRVERATRKNSQLAPAQRVAMKMGRRLRCSSVTYRFRYAPSSRLAGGPF